MGIKYISSLQSLFEFSDYQSYPLGLGEEGQPLLLLGGEAGEDPRVAQLDARMPQVQQNRRRQRRAEENTGGSSIIRTR